MQNIPCYIISRITAETPARVSWGVALPHLTMAGQKGDQTMQKKKNSLSKVIQGNQIYHGITELTVFDEYDQDTDIRVCYSGSLDSFNAVGKLGVGMILYRQNLLKRTVERSVVFHEKLFVWLDEEKAVG